MMHGDPGYSIRCTDWHEKSGARFAGSPAVYDGAPGAATYFVLWLVRRIVPASTLPEGDVCT